MLRVVLIFFYLVYFCLIIENRNSNNFLILLSDIIYSGYSFYVFLIEEVSVFSRVFFLEGFLVYEVFS